MHATLKLNKFHSLTFAGQTRYTIPEITWLYPQEKFLLRSTSRYTYVLCIVYKCWCSCERGIFVWRESHPRKKKGKFGYLYNYIFTSGAYHIRMMHASTGDTGQAQNLRIEFRLLTRYTYTYKRISFQNYLLPRNFTSGIQIRFTIEREKGKNNGLSFMNRCTFESHYEKS